MGVAGAELAGQSILITATATGWIMSMALGEWLSVQSARELFEHQIGIERDEPAMAPEEEAQDLALSIRRKDFPPMQARDLGQGRAGSADGARYARAGRAGRRSRQLGGSAWEAATRPFSSSRPGRSFPSCPIFHQGTTAVIISLTLSVIGLFIIGAAITVITGRSALLSGLRQVLSAWWQPPSPGLVGWSGPPLWMMTVRELIKPRGWSISRCLP